MFFFVIVLMHITWLEELHSLSAVSFTEGMAAVTHRVSELHVRLFPSTDAMNETQKTSTNM